MRDRLELLRRATTAPGYGSASFTETYTLIVETWGSIKTLPAGVMIFDDVDLGSQPTHLFKIRFRTNFTAEDRVGYKSNYYEVVKIDNVEERDDFLFIYAKLVGKDDLEANQ